MIAIETTIVSTALPQIVGNLGEFQLYSWVFSSFLLAQTATTMVFGKLADVYGRKPILLVGIGIFLVGSVLCGFAWSMPSLIGFRLLQGLGAGALLPVNLTVVGDLYPAHERGRVQGWLASVWGVASVAGPLAGGLIIQHLPWAWVFWINVPIGLFSAAGFFFCLRETAPTERRHIDVLGASLITIAVTALMIASLKLSLLALAVWIAAMGLLTLQERRAPDPLIAFALWSRRAIATTNAATLFLGMALMGLTTFLPMYVQIVMGRSPLFAGFMLTAIVLGWPIGSTIAARSFPRLGLKRVLMIGATLIPIGAIPFVLLTPTMSPYVAGLGSLIMGLGMGFFSTTGIVTIQESVGKAERGSATASNLFARNLGSTFGATALGAVLNSQLSQGGTVSLNQIEQSLTLSAGAGLSASREALGNGLHTTFWVVLAISVATFLIAFLVPGVEIKTARD